MTALLLAILIFGACSSAKKQSGNIDLESSNSIEMEETEGHGEVIGIVTVRGKLYHSKGAMAQIDKMIISGSDLSEEGTKLWTPEYEAMVGKVVEAKGQHYKYICGTHEQCLSSGVINYLQKVEYIKLVK